METEHPQTLYPKITAKVRDVIFRLEESDPASSGRTLSLTGTVKLHGTHGDVVFPAATSKSFVLQSRHKPSLSDSRDNFGFVEQVYAITPSIISLRDQFLARYKALHPSAADAQVAAHPLIIAFEYVGKGIHKGTAINALTPRALVIISVQINGAWQNDEDYATVHAEADRVFNIARGGFYHEELHIPSDAEEPPIEHLIARQKEVAAQCPFAATFGIDGIGEGIVWKPLLAKDPRLTLGPEFWLKTKAPEFWTSQRVLRVDRNREKREMAPEVAAQLVTERRLEQGIEWMYEMGFEVSLKNAEQFIEWLWGDVVKEDGRDIDELRVQRKRVKTEVGKIGGKWYRERAGGAALEKLGQLSLD